MRILLISGSYPPMKCGVGDYTAALAQALSDAGHQVGIVTSTAATIRPEKDSAEVFPVMDTWDRSEFAKLKQAVVSFKPDIIHLQHPTLGYGRGNLPWRLSYLAYALPVPLVQTWHELLRSKSTPRISDLTMALSRGDVIVVRPGFREQMPRWFRWASRHKRYDYIPNAPTIPRVELSAGQRKQVRANCNAEGKRLIAFFGFLYEHKGIDDLLQILDSQTDRLLLIGEVKQNDPYQVELVRRLAAPPYSDFVSLTGYLEGPEVGELLAAADVIALPYRLGGGSWNTSLHAAVLQGTFVLTTSHELKGFDAGLNVYYARPGDIGDLRAGLEKYAGNRLTSQDVSRLPSTWQEVANRHIDFYQRHLVR